MGEGGGGGEGEERGGGVDAVGGKPQKKKGRNSQNLGILPN